MQKENVIQKKSHQFALYMIEIVKTFPRNTEGFVVGKQLLRSGTSIGANVEEAIAAFSRKDFIFKMNIALKEARESHYWLRLLRDSDILECKSNSVNKESF